jgi:hypothetical protein
MRMSDAAPVQQDGVVPETRRPTVGTDALAEWCTVTLGMVATTPQYLAAN